VTGTHPVLHVGSFGSADPTSPVRPARPWARTFRGTPASVPEARRFVAELLAGCPAREVLMTCASELCANAVVHTASGNGGVFILEVDLPRDGVARIAVTDQGGPSLPAAGHLDLMAEGGRGLAMVAACTSRWGYIDAYSGRTVWAEACWPVSVPTPRQPAPAQRAPRHPASGQPPLRIKGATIPGPSGMSRHYRRPLQLGTRSPVRSILPFAGSIRAYGRIRGTILHRKLPEARILPGLQIPAAPRCAHLPPRTTVIRRYHTPAGRRTADTQGPVPKHSSMRPDGHSSPDDRPGDRSGTGRVGVLRPCAARVPRAPIRAACR
jgi:serine/threonine-protein kinase RsbW